MGISQEELSFRSNVAQSVISNAEKCHNIKYDMLIHIIKSLEINLDDELNYKIDCLFKKLFYI